MARNCQAVQGFLENKFPDLEGKVDGETYPVPPMVQLALRLFSYVQLFGLAWMIMGGENLFRLMGYKDQLPRIYWQAQESWFPIMIFVYFIGPSIVNSFAVSGAFEIYLDGKVIFSKLATGAFPKEEDLVNPLVAAGLRMASAE